MGETHCSHCGDIIREQEGDRSLPGTSYPFVCTSCQQQEEGAQCNGSGQGAGTRPSRERERREIVRERREREIEREERERVLADLASRLLPEREESERVLAPRRIPGRPGMPQLPSNPLAQIAQQMAAQMGIPQEMPYGSAPGSVPACIAFVNAITALQHPHTQRAQHPHIQHAQQPRTGTQDPTDAQEDADFALALSLQEQEDAGMAPTLSSGLGGGVGGGAGKRGADPTWEESSRSTRGKFPQVRDQGMIDITDRYALLIGNSNYQGTLRDGVSRCTKDAEDMARQLACDTLGVCKFKTRVLFNKTKEEIENSIRDWSRSLPRRCVALVMFAGHALEAQAKNYLVPVDAPESMSEAEIQYKCISLDYIMACILQQLGRESLIIALLDCCREETVTRGLRTLGGTGKRGLGPVNLSDPDSAAVFVGYAAAPGMVAMERPQR